MKEVTYAALSKRIAALEAENMRLEAEVAHLRRVLKEKSNG